MSKAWAASYNGGWGVRVEEVEVVKTTPKQVVVADGVSATGFRTRLGPEEVHSTEADALRVVLLDIEAAMRRSEEEVLRHRDAMARVKARLDALKGGTP